MVKEMEQLELIPMPKHCWHWMLSGWHCHRCSLFVHKSYKGYVEECSG